MKPQMKSFSAILILTIVSAAFWPVYAHENPLDKNGCHQDGIYGKYHCHEGKYAGKSFVRVSDYPGASDDAPRLTQDAPVKMNNSGVCITSDSVLYDRQTKYWVYPSVKECLRNGGHLDGAVVIGR